MEFHVGFTGTRAGMTLDQRTRLRHAFISLVNTYGAENVVVHHGVCIGSDAQFHSLAEDHGCRVIGHPGPDYGRGRFVIEPTRFHELRPVAPYLVRNGHIAEESATLIATPATAHEMLRSGTWATVRRARKLGRPVLLLTP